MSVKSRVWCLRRSLSDWIPCSQAAVSGPDWISKRSSRSAPAGSFFHQERRPPGLRSRQDRTHRLTASETISICDVQYILQIAGMFSGIHWSLTEILSSVQVSRRPNFKELSQDYARCQRWLNKKRIKAFYTSVYADNMRHGTQFLLQVGTPGCKHFLWRPHL